MRARQSVRLVPDAKMMTRPMHSRLGMMVSHRTPQLGRCEGRSRTDDVQAVTIPAMPLFVVEVLHVLDTAFAGRDAPLNVCMVILALLVDVPDAIVRSVIGMPGIGLTPYNRPSTDASSFVDQCPQDLCTQGRFRCLPDRDGRPASSETSARKGTDAALADRIIVRKSSCSVILLTARRWAATTAV